MDEDVRPGQQLAAGIVDVDLDEQRAGGEVDRVGVPHERALEGPPGELIEGEGRGGSGTGRARVDLGDGHEHAERVDGRHVEELSARRRRRSRVDQDADVHIARRDDPVERREDLLKSLELLEPADVRDIRIHGGLHRAERAHRHVRLLLGDRVALEERLPAVGGDLSLPQIGLRRLEIGPGLLELLIDLGRLDLGEELPLLHVGADVEVPGLHVAVGAREDRRVGEGLGGARQQDFLSRGVRLGRDDVDDRDGGLRGGVLQRPVRHAACPDARVDAETEGDGHRGDQQEGAEVWWAPHHADLDERRPCSRANTDGTKTRVATVAHSRPPMTARPSGAFCSPPSPSPSAMGTMPMIMASAVIKTGRKRVKPASTAAIATSPCSRSRSLAKDTTRMLLAVATPTLMMAPISAGTLSVVPVRNRNTTIPARAAGSAMMMMKGSSQDWKFTTISK